MALPTPSKRLRTGVPGGVAFAATIIATQAWMSILFGILTIISGSLLNDFGGSVGSSCSGDFLDSCNDLGASASNAGHTAELIGIGVVTLGVLLLVGVIGALCGQEGGRGLCVVLELLFLIIALLAGISSESWVIGLILGLPPLFAVIGMADNDANRMIKDAKVPLSSPNP